MGKQRGAAAVLEVVDRAGLAVVRGAAPPELRAAAFDRLFQDPCVSQGQCGGRGWAPKLPARVGFDGLGAQCHSTVDTAVVPDLFDEGPVAELNGRLHAAAPEALKAFCADTVEVLGVCREPASVSAKNPVYGWLTDGDVTHGKADPWAKKGSDYIYRGDGTPKVYANFGACAVTWGFKYAKNDAEHLAVRLEPGDAVVRWGEARAWYFAFIGLENAGGDSPFAFLSVKLCDHRELKAKQPALHKRVHEEYRSVKPFKPSGMFQYAWRYVGDGEVEIRDVNRGSAFEPPPRAASFSPKRRDVQFDAAKEPAKGLQRQKTGPGEFKLGEPVEEAVEDTPAKGEPMSWAARAKAGAQKSHLSGVIDEADKITTKGGKTIEKIVWDRPEKEDEGKTGRWGKKVPRTTAPAAAARPEDAQMRDLLARVDRHCKDESLVKGWEAERRTCIGKARAGLRAAARDIRAKSTVAVKAATAPGASLSAPERAYLANIALLYKELAAAGEQDFDSHLRDGRDWLQAKLGIQSEATASVSAATWEKHGAVCEDVQKRCHKQRASGHHGRAIDRDLRAATRWADESRSIFAQLAAGGCEGEELTALELKYMDAIKELCVELSQEGEPDFDGQLRTCINFLENGGRKVCW